MIRQPAVAGTFYPASSETLEADVRSTLQKIPHLDLPGPLRGLICPHAGYIYSGLVAAHGYSLIPTETIETVIVLGPSHHVYFEGASLFPGEGYETPLGVLPINTYLQDALAKNPIVGYLEEAHAKEHSLEVHLPFLQVAFDETDFSILPILIGGHKLDVLDRLAKAISDVADPKTTLVLASSDFSHFHSYEKAKEKDLLALDYIKRGDIKGLIKDAQSKKIEMCGFSPIVVTELILGYWGVTNRQVLNYANSGDVTGDHSSVVGYGTVAYYD